MLPNLIIIGAMKCGTSALHQYLGEHPEIVMSEEKELNFFLEDKNWSKGRAWYESMFQGEANVYGESSPDYTNHPAFPGVPERMHALIPDARLIYMVRDPIERIVSQYMHNRWSDVEHRPITEAVRGSATVPMEETRYVRRSKYYMQIEQYLRYYPRSRILIVTQEDLFKRRQETLRTVFRFLEADDTFQSGAFSTLVHETGEKKAKNRLGLVLAQGHPRGLLRRLPRVIREPAEALVRTLVTSKVERPELGKRERQDLAAILREDIDKFRAFAGRPFTDWSV